MLLPLWAEVTAIPLQVLEMPMQLLNNNPAAAGEITAGSTLTVGQEFQWVLPI